MGPEKKHPVLTIYFPLFPPNQTHSKKVFFIFSPKFFIYPISPQNKDTLNDLCFKIQDIFLHEMGFRPIQSLCTFRASDPSQLFQALWVMTHGLLYTKLGCLVKEHPSPWHFANKINWYAANYFSFSPRINNHFFTLHHCLLSFCGCNMRHVLIS